MTTPNTANGNAEVNENINTQDSGENIYSKLTRKFVKEKLKNKSKRAGFVKSVNADGELTPDLLEQIRDFAGTDKDFDGLTIESSNITYSSIQREVSGYTTTINNNRRQVQTRFLQENDISADEYESKISKKVESLEEPELNALLVRSSERTKLLQNIYGKNKVPKSKNMMTFLNDFNLANRYQKLDEHEKLLVQSVDNKMKKSLSLDASDFVTLFETDVFNDNEKKQMLRAFVPTISLAKAVDLGFFSQSDAQKYKIKIAKEISNAKGDDLAVVVEKMNNREIQVPTYDFLGKTKNAQKIVDDVEPLRDFVKDYNTMSDEVVESMQGIKTLQDFQTELARLPGVSGANRFKEGAIIEIKQTKLVNGKSEDYVLYGKILKTTDTGEIKLLDRGNGRYTTNSQEVTTETYDDILELIIKGKPDLGFTTKSFSVLSDAELKTKLASGDIKTSLDNGLAQVEKGDIQDRLDELDDELKQRKLYLKQSGKTDDEIESDPEIQRIGGEQLEQSKALMEADETNEKSLKRQIDELDSKGEKYGLEKGTTFQVGKGKLSGNFYTITGISTTSGKINLTSPGGNEDLDFSAFFNEFKESDCKRVSKANTFQDLFDNMSLDGHEDIKGIWNSFEFKDGKIQKKDSKTKIEYDFLAGMKGGSKELIQIHDEANGFFTISLGDITSAKKDKKDAMDDKGNIFHQKAEPEKFSVSDKKMVVTAGWIQAYINKHKLEPRSLKDSQEIDPNADKLEKLNEKFNMWSFLGKGLNIATVMASGKVFYEGLENYFKEGRDESAARFAYAWGKHLLPGDMKGDLQSRIEEAQGKRMEDYLNRLKKLASFAAVEMIDGWLHDKHAKQEKKEAALEFMWSKYGVCCAKDLRKYQGKFVWYQAFGGTIGDELYMDVKAQNEAANLQFSEEDLVWQLVAKQCKPGGYKGIKRRSKWYKALKKLRSTGKTEEMDTGRNDAGDERTIDARNSGAMSELYSGNYPNAIGWLEKVVSKGGPMKTMNKVPFILAFSGAAYNFDPKVTNDAMKKFPAEGMLLMMMRFMSYTKDMDLLNATILEVSKSLEKKGGKFAGIQSRAQRLHDNLKIPHKLGEGKKIEEAEKFYADYGEAITNALYMLNTGKTEGTGGDRSINKMILLEKDENATFKKYHDTLSEYVESDDTTFMKEEYMKDAFYKAGISGLHTNKISRSLLEFSSANSFRHGDSGKFVWEEIKEELLAIPHDSNLTMSEKQFLVKDLLRGFISGLISKGIRDETFKGLNDPRSPMAILNKWGMYLYDDIKESKLNEESFLTNHPRAESLLDMYAGNIISGGDYSKSGGSGEFSLNELIGRTSDLTREKINGKKEEKNETEKRVDQVLDREDDLEYT